MPSFQRPDGIVQVMVAERSVPRSVIVDQHGRRFTNEAAPYVTFVHDQLAGGHEPTWFVFDERAKKRYPIGGIMPGQKFPTSWIDGGLVVVADTVEELAHQIDVPVAGLTETSPVSTDSPETGRTRTSTAARARTTTTTAIRACRTPPST